MQKSVGFEIRAITNQLKRHINSLPVFQQYDLRGGRGYILGFLYDHADRAIYQKDIEKEFRISKSTVTEVLQLMEKNGFITRESSKKDGRMKRLLPTQKALTIRQEVMENIRTVENKLKAGIREEDYRTCLKVLKKMSENLSKEENNMKGREEMYE